MGYEFCTERIPWPESSGIPLPQVIVLPVVPESAAPDRVHNNQDDEEYNVNHSHLLPIMLDVIQQPSLAGIAVEAQNTWIIVPQPAIRIAV